MEGESFTDVSKSFVTQPAVKKFIGRSVTRRYIIKYLQENTGADVGTIRSAYKSKFQVRAPPLKSFATSVSQARELLAKYCGGVDKPADGQVFENNTSPAHCQALDKKLIKQFIGRSRCKRFVIDYLTKHPSTTTSELRDAYKLKCNKRSVSKQFDLYVSQARDLLPSSPQDSQASSASFEDVVIMSEMQEEDEKAETIESLNAYITSNSSTSAQVCSTLFGAERTRAVPRKVRTCGYVCSVLLTSDDKQNNLLLDAAALRNFAALKASRKFQALVSLASLRSNTVKYHNAQTVIAYLDALWFRFRDFTKVHARMRHMYMHWVVDEVFGNRCSNGLDHNQGQVDLSHYHLKCCSSDCSCILNQLRNNVCLGDDVTYKDYLTRIGFVARDRDLSIKQNKQSQSVLAKQKSAQLLIKESVLDYIHAFPEQDLLHDDEFVSNLEFDVNKLFDSDDLEPQSDLDTDLALLVPPKSAESVHCRAVDADGWGGFSEGDRERALRFVDEAQRDLQWRLPYTRLCTSLIPEMQVQVDYTKRTAKAVRTCKRPLVEQKSRTKCASTAPSKSTPVATFRLAGEDVPVFYAGGECNSGSTECALCWDPAVPGARLCRSHVREFTSETKCSSSANICVADTDPVPVDYSTWFVTRGSTPAAKQPHLRIGKVKAKRQRKQKAFVSEGLCTDAVVQHKIPTVADQQIATYEKAIAEKQGDYYRDRYNLVQFEVYRSNAAIFNNKHESNLCQFYKEQDEEEAEMFRKYGGSTCVPVSDVNADSLEFGLEDNSDEDFANARYGPGDYERAWDDDSENALYSRLFNRYNV